MLLQLPMTTGNNSTTRIAVPVLHISAITEHIQMPSSPRRSSNTDRLIARMPMEDDMFRGQVIPPEPPPQTRPAINWTIIYLKNGHQYTIAQSFDEVFALYSKALSEIP